MSEAKTNRLKDILVFSNRTKDITGEKTKELIRLLQKEGCSVYQFEPEDEEGVITLSKGTDLAAAGIHLDLAVVLGGDGTMIRCGHLLQRSDVPIIGINLGTLGYLTEIELEAMEYAIHKALSGDFYVEQRLMLEARIGDDPKEYTAINDLVIHRDLSDGILTLRCDINGHLLGEFMADGVIIASPCGSTAYNFSAGGPIVNPVSDNLILTPLCSHGMLNRSIILRGDDELSFHVSGFTKGENALFIADGNKAVPIGPDTWVYVKKSRYTFPLARVSTRSFYEVVQKKMRP